MKKYKTIKQFINIPVWSIGKLDTSLWLLDKRYAQAEFQWSSDGVDLYRYSYHKDIVEFLTEYFEEIKEQIDFSKFIGRCNTELCIKWTKYLKSFEYWDIRYSTINRDIYNDPICYTECKLSDLQYWDVFFVKWMDINRLAHYGIFMGIDNKWIYHFQRLPDFIWMDIRTELIINNYYSYDKDVYKFNRN